MRNEISPELAARYAINLTQASAKGLNDVLYLIEDPTRIKQRVEARQKEIVHEVSSKILNAKLVKNLIEKMRITGTNQWTSIADVTSNRKDVDMILDMVKNGLLDKNENLVRFIDGRTFSVVDKNVK